VVFERADGGDGGSTGALGCLNDQIVDVMPESPVVVFALDRTMSMNEPFGSSPGAPSKLYAARDALVAVIKHYQAVVRFAYVGFPGIASGSCFPESCCSIIDMPVPTLDIATYIDGQLAFCDDPTNNCAVGMERPTAQVLATLAQSPGGPGFGHGNRAVVLVTDGDPGCAGGSNDPCNDAYFQVSNLINNAGVHTNVVGLGTSPDDRCLKQQLASAGSGMYASPTRSSDLQPALEGIVSKIARGACALNFGSNSQIDPSQLHVYLNGMSVPHDNQNGWDFEYPQIVLNGQACDMFLASGLPSPTLCTTAPAPPNH
jgi:hypothetical protein